MRLKNLLLLFLTGALLLLTKPSHAQQDGSQTLETADLFTEKSTLNPNKAALYSAILPGLGQIYNKQPWKLPFVYGGLFAVGFFINFNNQYFHELRNALAAEIDEIPATVNPFMLSRDALTTRVEQFRRDRDFLIIVGVAVYVLNIIDAHISAHLEEFSINDDLSIGFEPSVTHPAGGARNVGLSLVLNFK